MKRELEPIELKPGTQFWENVLDKINFDTSLILPVEIKDDESGMILGRFHLSLENGINEKFIQFENFSSTEFAEIFLQEISKELLICPGGIYRLKI